MESKKINFVWIASLNSLKPKKWLFFLINQSNSFYIDKINSHIMKSNNFYAIVVKKKIYINLSGTPKNKVNNLMLCVHINKVLFINLKNLTFKIKLKVQNNKNLT